LDEFVAKNDLQESEKMAVRYVLSRRHTHQYEQVIMIFYMCLCISHKYIYFNFYPLYL